MQAWAGGWCRGAGAGDGVQAQAQGIAHRCRHRGWHTGAGTVDGVGGFLRAEVLAVCVVVSMVFTVPLELAIMPMLLVFIADGLCRHDVEEPTMDFFIVHRRQWDSGWSPFSLSACKAEGMVWGMSRPVPGVCWVLSGRVRAGVRQSATVPCWCRSNLDSDS